MDYEKLHKDTITKLQEMVNSGKITAETARGICADFIPESEDERMRKGLIAIITDFESLFLQENYSLSREETLAWLEKQGDKDKLIKELGEYQVKYTQEVLEKQINSMSNKEDERLRKTTISFLKKFADKGYENAVECIDWLEAQWEQNITNSCCKTFNDEQKSADKVEPKFKVGDIIYKPSNSSCPVHSSIDGTLCTVIEVLDKHYILDTNEGRIQESFAWQDYYELVKQKPAWSEEDETALGDALWCCKQAASIAKDENDMGNVWCAERWLKDLKERYTWKPNELQIKALAIAIRCGIKLGTWEEEALKDLIEQLKKLREE